VTNQRSLTGRDCAGLLVLFVIAAGLRIYAWHHTHVLFNDGPIFLAMAEAIAEGRLSDVLSHPFHPLYPAAIVVFHALLPLGWEGAAVAVSIFGGLLSVGAVFWCVRRAFDPALGWLAALTVALHPWAVDFSSDVMSDALYIGLFLVGFAALSEWMMRPGVVSAVVAGASAGLAYLVRPEGVGLAVLAVILMIGRGVLLPAERRASVRGALAILVPCALVMAPLLGALTMEQGELTLTRKKSMGALVAGDAMPAAAPVVALKAPLIPLPRSSERLGGPSEVRPPRTPAGAFDAVSRALRTSLASFRYEIGAFAVLGLIALRGRWSPLREATFFLPGLAYSTVLILLVWGAGYVARRHALAALLPLTAYAALGWRVLCESILERRSPAAEAGAPTDREWRGREQGGRRAVGIFVALALLLTVSWGARDFRERREDRAAVRTAAEWLSERGGAGAFVAAQKLRVAYYAGGTFVPLPSGGDGRIRERLLARGVRWLVIDEVRLDEHWGLAAGLGNWLQIIHVEARAGRRALVLELR